MVDDNQNFAVFNSRILVDTVGHVTDEALKASRIKDVIGVLAGRLQLGPEEVTLPPSPRNKMLCARDSRSRQVDSMRSDSAFSSDQAPANAMSCW